jgi:glutathione S-transferase
MLKLFHAWGSCSQASLIALEEAGAEYELALMSTKTGDQRRAEYLAVNPKGRVPVLITDHGALTETPAILAYIAQTHPKAKLAPQDPWDFARMQAFNSYLCSTVHVAHAHKHRGYRWATQEASFRDMTSKVAENETECFRLIEEMMLEGPWVLGENYSVADPYLFTIAGWLADDGVDIAQFPKVAAHFARMGDRPAVKAVFSKRAA